MAVTAIDSLTYSGCILYVFRVFSPFSLRVCFTFGKRANVYQRSAVELRQWSFACSDTTMQRLHDTLRLTR
jgi:hypothetical protein